MINDFASANIAIQEVAGRKIRELVEENQDLKDENAMLKARIEELIDKDRRPDWSSKDVRTEG